MVTTDYWPQIAACFVIQWIGWIFIDFLTFSGWALSFAFKTEKLYDLTGALTYIFMILWTVFNQLNLEKNAIRFFILHFFKFNSVLFGNVKTSDDTETSTATPESNTGRWREIVQAVCCMLWAIRLH